MRPSRTLALFAALALAACGRGRSPAAATPAAFGAAVCGDGFCTAGETSASCGQDCPASTFAGEVKTVYIQSEGIGQIAVLVAIPLQGRYEEGAGIVVVVPPVFVQAEGFTTDPDASSLGLIQVSYLWPGHSDPALGVRSEGQFDYGGPQSAQVLRDVVRFAAGRLPDVRGRYITAVSNRIPPLTEEVGLYAFSDAGLAAVAALSAHSSQMPGLQYYIGRENPTVDSLTCLELGHRSDAGEPVQNPFYSYPSSYSPGAISLNYAGLRWDPDHTDSHTGFTGRPYLDLDGNRSVTPTDYVFSWRVPVMDGKRFFSAGLTEALLNSGVLTEAAWPEDLATPQEAALAWASRQASPDRFAAMRTSNLDLDLKVMLVFAVDDHLQVAADKPHIHQALQGFRFTAGFLWVRLNPDRAYVQSLLPAAGSDFPDNPADNQPEDWAQIGSYAYPGRGQAGRLVPLAAIAEMADRAHTGRWDENLGRAFYTYTAPTPEP
jgi:hypothetical protein